MLYFPNCDDGSFSGPKGGSWACGGEVGGVLPGRTLLQASLNRRWLQESTGGGSESIKATVKPKRGLRGGTKEGQKKQRALASRLMSWVGSESGERRGIRVVAYAGQEEMNSRAGWLAEAKSE